MKRISFWLLLVAVVVLVVGIGLSRQSARATATEEQKIFLATGLASEQFANDAQISADGTRLVLAKIRHDEGAVVDQGAALVYVRSGTTWTFEQQLLASDGLTTDFFGFTVSINADGSRIAVGANSDDVGANTGQGSAYIFTRSGTTWTEEQKVTASDGAASDGFGEVFISADGTRLIVGAAADDVGANANQGSVYVFSRSGTTWTEEQKLTASDGAASDVFGGSNRNAINADGTRIAVGVPGDDIGANTNQGSIYVYSRSGTTWTEEQKVTASDGTLNDNFANSVSMDSTGSRIAVGSQAAEVGADASQGQSYVFSRSGTTWTEEQILTASDFAAGDLFGSSVFLSDDGSRLVIGASSDDLGAANQGSAYIFTRSGATWTQLEKFFAADGALNDNFGAGITTDESAVRILANVFSDDIGANADQGSAYVFVASLPVASAGGQIGSGCSGSLTAHISVHGGSLVPDDVQLYLDARGMDPDFAYTVTCETHVLSADPVPDYSLAWSGDCASDGSVSLVSGGTKSCTVIYTSTIDAPVPSSSPSISPTPSITLSDFNLHEGDAVSAFDSNDPDVYIVNEHGYKRLFLNPLIFSFYGHLNGFAGVKAITSLVRDLFPTSGLFRNCETDAPEVYALTPTAEDAGTLHHMDLTGTSAVSQDPAFFKKVFCMNNLEFNWYPKGTPFTSLTQVPVYTR